MSSHKNAAILLKENPGALADATGSIQGIQEACGLRNGSYRELTPEASAQRLSGNWNRARWSWKRSVKRDTRLGDAAKIIAITLCDDFANHETGRCNPLIATLADAVGKSERSVQRGLAELIRFGWIKRREVRGRGAAMPITFTARTSVGAVLLPENVRSLTDHREKTAAKMADKRVTKPSPINTESDYERVTDSVEKGDRFVTPYIEPKKTKGTRTPRDVEKPVLNNASVAHIGSCRESSWNQYLTDRGKPVLAELRVRSSDADGVGWEVPFRQPPSEHDDTSTRITRRWIDWAVARMEASHDAA